MAGRYWGGNSMIWPLKRVLVYPPVPPHQDASWQAFGYVHEMDHQLASAEHEAFRGLLRAAGVEVVTGEIDDAMLQDGIFPYDPVFTTERGAILTSMGKELRESEVDLAERTMADLNVPIAGRIQPPGKLEGGDCLWIDDHTLAIGRGYRTNNEGIRQMAEILGPQDVDVLTFGLPHWNGPAECLHLLSMISMLDDDLAVVYLPLMDVGLVRLLQDRGIEMIETPASEFSTQAPNVLVTAPRQCVILRENTETAALLRAAGCSVTTYAGDEISHNRTGGPTCLTRPILRERSV